MNSPTARVGAAGAADAGHPAVSDDGADESPRHALRDPAVQALAVSRFATTLGISALSYGAMVYLATVGASQATVSLMGAARYLAALIFGIGGGALAEAMSKRTAMVTAYILQAAACFIVPTVWGTSVSSLIFLIFLVAMLGQIVTPAVKAATALVATAAQVAVVAAVVSVAGGIGAAMGAAFLAPILINVATMRTVAYVAGLVMILGAVRTLKLPHEAGAASARDAVRAIDWKTAIPSRQRTAEWLLANRRVGAMILVGAMVVALFDGLNTLMPVYVRDVLGADPTFTVYIMAPGGIGFLAGSVLGPWLMDRQGERRLAIGALMILSLSFVLFGLIDLVAPLLAPFSPLRLLGMFGVTLTPAMQAAGMIAILTAFGSTGAGAAVQTYVNRNVILARQATTFGMQEVLDNAMILFAVLALGTIATVFGSRVVFIFAPILVVAVVVWLIQASFRLTDRDTPEARRIVQALFHSTEERLGAESTQQESDDGPSRTT
ncbi:MAG TPA: MFS transporter [Thermomicrobiales bacterium]|nr:MFS transporter [Thermomicrobiales bacterium]